MKKLKNKYGIAVACTLAVSLAALSGCSSSSGTAKVDEDNTGEDVVTSFSGRAIDGFIVGGDLTCDGEANGKTGVKGSWTCPAGTTLARVTGGIDVGYSETETEEGLPFVGALTGPANGEFLTPLTTLVVLLSSDTSGNYDPSKRAAAEAVVKKSLNLTTLDLSVDPEQDIAMARLNAQISVIASSLSATAADYEVAMQGLADLLTITAENDETFDVSGENSANFDAKMSQLNTLLGDSGSGLGRYAEDLQEFIDEVQDAVAKIETVEDHAGMIKEVADIPLTEYALGIYKSAPAVTLVDAYDQTYQYSMVNYITPEKNNYGRHQIVVSKGVKKVKFDNSSITVQKTLTDQVVDVGIKIEADDGRELNVIGRGALISMVQGDSSSVDITIPDDMIWEANATAADNPDGSRGTRAYTQLQKSGDRVFSSSAQGIVIDFDAIVTRLGNVSAEYDKQDFIDLSNEVGDFKVTFVVDGIKVAKIVQPASGGEIIYSAWGYTVEVKKGSADTVVDSIYAPGWEGYFTVE